MDRTPKPDPDKPDFVPPVDINPETYEATITLNPAQDAFLKVKEDQYRERLRSNPAKLDAKVKLLVISTLRSKGKVTMEEIGSQLDDTELNHRDIALILQNAFMVIGSYNSGRKEDLAHVRMGKDQQLTRDQQNQVRALHAVFRDYSPLEQEIGYQLRKLLQSKEDRTEGYAVRGSGAGGQKINKTSSCIELRHLPTGIMVRVQKHREQSKNRASAYKLLLLKIEERMMGKKSENAQKIFKLRKQKQKRSKRAKEKILQEKHHHSEIKEGRKPIF